METVQAIFTQLGVNNSLLPQFIIIFVVFMLAQFLFLGRLQEVLETREEKTVKLENSADETIENVTKMQAEYKEKLGLAQSEALKIATDKKYKISNKYIDQYKQTEREVNQFVDQTRNDNRKEVEQSKEMYLSETSTLAQSLVQKILQ
ncbi:MAG TPA: ATP synthase F0 subunit B [Bacteriovoracaceae bacterium]|nr:ATP synthase F0 subunit B [Bacteriovoracaceae bacterium]